MASTIPPPLLSLFTCKKTLPTPLPSSLVHATLISILYVSSLYIFVPYNIRVLDRSDRRQILGRIKAVCFVTAFVVLVYFPLAFCESISDGDGGGRGRYVWEHLSMRYPLSSSVSSTSSFTINPLLHVISLFLGPLTVLTLEILQLTKNITHHPPSTSSPSPSPPTYTALKQATIQILLSNSNLPPTLNIFTWPTSKLRDLIIGPITEELCFRSVLLPLILSVDSTIMSAMTAVFITPLFFGVAHIHHAYNLLTKPLHSRASTLSIIIQTLFQFTYTYVFGVYSTYTLYNTNAIMTPILLHVFCNYMGVPNFSSFMNPWSSLYGSRNGILGCYVLGIILFVGGFWSLERVEEGNVLVGLGKV